MTDDPNAIPRGAADAPALVTVPDHEDTIRRTRKQRRPTGAPPPLRRRMGASGRFWLAMIAFASIVTVLLLQVEWIAHLTDRVETGGCSFSRSSVSSGSRPSCAASRRQDPVGG